MHIVVATLLPAVFVVFAHDVFLAFGGSLVDWVFRVNARTRLSKSFVGNVRDLAAMQARRIAEQEIAFAVQAVGAVLANDHARILFKSHFECDASGEATAQGRRHDHFIRPLRSKDKMNPSSPS